MTLEEYTLKKLTNNVRCGALDRDFCSTSTLMRCVWPSVLVRLAGCVFSYHQILPKVSVNISNEIDI